MLATFSLQVRAQPSFLLQPGEPLVPKGTFLLERALQRDLRLQFLHSLHLPSGLPAPGRWLVGTLVTG